MASRLELWRELRAALRDELPAAVALRHELHAQPDLSGAEGPTAATVAARWRPGRARVRRYRPGRADRAGHRAGGGGPRRARRAAGDRAHRRGVFGPRRPDARLRARRPPGRAGRAGPRRAAGGAAGRAGRRAPTCCVLVSTVSTIAAAAAIMLSRKSAGRAKSVKIAKWGRTVFAIAVTAVCISSGVQRGRGILSDLSCSTVDSAAMSRIGWMRSFRILRSSDSSFAVMPNA